MHSQLELFPMGTPGDPTIDAQDAFVAELDAIDLAETLVRAAGDQPLTVTEIQKLLLLASDLSAGRIDIVSQLGSTDPAVRAFIAPF